MYSPPPPCPKNPYIGINNSNNHNSPRPLKALEKLEERDRQRELNQDTNEDEE
jgi:hypothetical protein